MKWPGISLEIETPNLSGEEHASDGVKWPGISLEIETQYCL